MEKSIREVLSEGYKVIEKKQDVQEQTHVELKVADIDKSSPIRLLSWGFRKLQEQADSTDLD
jgi:hypothetical protein